MQTLVPTSPKSWLKRLPPANAALFATNHGISGSRVSRLPQKGWGLASEAALRACSVHSSTNLLILYWR